MVTFYRVTIPQTDDNCGAKLLTVLPPAWYCGGGNGIELLEVLGKAAEKSATKWKA